MYCIIRFNCWKVWGIIWRLMCDMAAVDSIYYIFIYCLESSRIQTRHSHLSQASERCFCKTLNIPSFCTSDLFFNSLESLWTSGKQLCLLSVWIFWISRIKKNNNIPSSILIEQKLCSSIRNWERDWIFMRRWGIFMWPGFKGKVW